MALIQDIGYVLVYGDEACCSSSCCSRDSTTDGKWREIFNRKMKKAGLELEDVVNPLNKDQHFVLISAHFDTLAKQAELMRLKLPLEYDTPEEESNFFKRWCCCCSKNVTKKIAHRVDRALKVDKEIGDFIARKFVYKEFGVYRGSDGDLKYFFRPALRSLLVYTILTELDISDEEINRLDLESDDLEYPSTRGCKKRGLLDLQRNGIYTSHFPLHDPSALDDRLGAGYCRRQSSQSSEDIEMTSDLLDKSDERLALYNTWFRCPAWFKFQPFVRIRDYFGEKISFYFAWCGHLITLLWFPALVGIGVFGYGLYLSIQDHTVHHVTTTAETTAIRNISESEIVLSSSAAIFEDALAIIRQSFDNDVTPWFAIFICIWGTVFTKTWRRRTATLAYEWDVDKFELYERNQPDYRGCVRSISRRETDKTVIQIGKYTISFIILLVMIAAVGLSVAGVIFFRIVATVDWFSQPSQEKNRFLVASILPPVMNAVSSLLLKTFYNRLALRLTHWENHRTQTTFDDALIIKVFLFQFVNCYTSLFYIAFFQSMEHKEGMFGQGSRYLDTCGPDKNCMSVLSFQLLVMMIVKPMPKFFKDIIIPVAAATYRRCRHCVGRARRKAVPDSDDPRADYVAAELAKKDLTLMDDFTLFEYSEKVIQFGYVTLFAASFPLAPLMALIIDIIDIRVDACRLLKLCRRPVGFMAEDIGMWESIVTFLSITGVVTNSFLIAFTSQWGQRQTTSWQFWIVIGFQNICLCLKFLLAFIIPNVSGDLKTRMAQEKRWIKSRVKQFREQQTQVLH